MDAALLHPAVVDLASHLLLIYSSIFVAVLGWLFKNKIVTLLKLSCTTVALPYYKLSYNAVLLNSNAHISKCLIHIISKPLLCGFNYWSTARHRFSSLAAIVLDPYFMANNHQLKNVTLNFGPNHPAAHGILKLSVQTQGEVLQRLDPQFGFLHRGTEKLFEHRNFYQNLPYFDRFDYVANLFQEHAYCLAVEELGFLGTQKTITTNLQHIRVLFDELSRLLNHLLTMSATCLDLGAMGPIFWAFEERERLMEFYERASGARMHVALYRPYDVDWTPLTSTFFADLARFSLRAGRAISGAVLGLLNNKILKTRLSGVGQLSTHKLNSYGITGVIARSAGLRKDLRLQHSLKYGAYSQYAIRSFLGRRGDNLDRFLIRVKESFEVFRTVSQVLANLSAYTKKQSNGITAAVFLQSQNTQKIATQRQQRLPTLPLLISDAYTSFLNGINLRTKFTAMEELIQHFKLSSDGCVVSPGFSYASVEGPKGEIGVTLVSAGYTKPFRLKIRTPVSHNMHLVPSMCNGCVFGDFVMSFCSFDVVLGEIDR